MTNSKKNVLVLYPHAHEERDAVSAMVRELTVMLGESDNVTLLASESKRRKALHYLTYMAKALRYALVHMREIDVIISVDVPTGVRLLGVLPRLMSGNRILNVSWVLDMYSLQVSRLQSGLLPRNRVREFWDNLGLRASTRVVVLGECMQEAVRQVSGKSSTVIPIWKELSAPRANLRGKFGIGLDQFVILYSGTAGPNHPMSALIEAAEAIGEHDDAVLLVAGRGSEVEKARESVAVSGATNIRFVDPVEDAEVPALLATADLHVAILDERVTGTCVPSKAYTAMAAGGACLFLGSADSQAAIDIAAADAGTTVGSSDVPAITDELKRYLSTPDLAASRGDNARRFISAERSIGVSTRKWQEIIA